MLNYSCCQKYAVFRRDRHALSYPLPFAARGPDDWGGAPMNGERPKMLPRSCLGHICFDFSVKEFIIEGAESPNDPTAHGLAAIRKDAIGGLGQVHLC